MSKVKILCQCSVLQLMTQGEPLGSAWLLAKDLTLRSGLNVTPDDVEACYVERRQLEKDIKEEWWDWNQDFDMWVKVLPRISLQNLVRLVMGDEGVAPTFCRKPIIEPENDSQSCLARF